MLSDHAPIPTLAVKDVTTARDFYEGVLGMTPVGEPPEGVVYTSGTSRFLVYPTSFAGTNKATAMSFQIPADAFDAEAAALREKGITFTTFEAEGLEWDDGVATMGGSMKSAWFSDPDGNVLNIESGL